METTKVFLDRMGLCVYEGALVYGFETGALRWAPAWLKHFIVYTWNPIHCAFAGHDQMGVELYKANAVPGHPTCSNCCARMKVNGRYLTDEEVKAHDLLVYAFDKEMEDNPPPTEVN